MSISLGYSHVANIINAVRGFLQHTIPSSSHSVIENKILMLFNNIKGSHAMFTRKALQVNLTGML